MAINKESNGYTFGFAIAMVVVVGAVLALIAMATKPFKDTNDEVKKKMDIVKALLPKDESEKINRKNAEEEFAKYVNLENALVIDLNGKKKEGQGEGQEGGHRRHPQEWCSDLPELEHGQV